MVRNLNMGRLSWIFGGGGQCNQSPFDREAAVFEDGEGPWVPKDVVGSRSRRRLTYSPKWRKWILPLEPPERTSSAQPSVGGETPLRLLTFSV